MIIHMFFVLSDLYLYGFEIIRILIDVILVWLNFINFMTLNKPMIALELSIYFMTIVAQIGHIQIMVMERTSRTLFMFIIQYFVVYVSAIIIIFRRLSSHQT